MPAPIAQEDDRTLPDISRVQIAVQSASEWTKHAEPIIREYLELDQMLARLQSKLFEARAPENPYLYVGKLEEAVRLVEKQFETFGEIIDATRKEFIAEEYFHTDMGASAAIEDRNIADNDAVEKMVPSVKDTIAAVSERNA
jgi:hypothetical protein